MTKIDKIIEKMRNSPLDWTIDDIEKIAAQFMILVRKGKGSHVTFSHPKWVDILTVPAHRPIKPIYVKKFIALLDKLIPELS